MDTPNGYDIAPGDERMIVDVIVGLSTEPGSEGEPIYEQHYLDRPANSRFYEPLDLSDQGSDVDAVQWTSGNTRADHQKFHSERERLKTFEGVWKLQYNVTKEDLARDGFIYKGPGDLVMCVFCLKSIRKWDKGDSVPSEHKRLYPRCPWVCEKVHHINIPISDKDNLKINMNVEDKGPKYSDMKTAEARGQTFQGWIRRDNVAVEALVKEGFFYDNVSDVVICFHCGIKIPGWNMEDNLTEQHARGSKNCPMVHWINQSANRSSKGEDMDVELSPNSGESSGAGAVQGQEQSFNIDEDMQSPAVQAIVLSYGDDYTIEGIRKAVESLRILKGPGHISSKEILKKLDPELDG